jgi:glycerol uptake facilitator-like aquaporin
MHKYNRAQQLLAEFAGTFAVVFIGAGAVAAGAYLRSHSTAATTITFLSDRFSGPLTSSIAYGAAYAAAVALLGHISSGNFNPAVSIAHWVTHRAGTVATLLYFAAQMAGATVAAYALRAIVPASATSAAMVGPPVLASDLTRGPALLIEATMTFALVVALWTTLVQRERPRFWLGGIVAGTVIAAASYAGSPYTGGVMNPARAFGPALAGRLWGYQGVYWVGPLAGAVAAATLCDALLRPKSPQAAPVPKASSL